MYKATFKSLASRKLRLLLSALAVVLGVMFVSGSFVLTDSLGKSFDALFTTVNSNLDVQVSAKPKLAGQDGGGAPTASVPAALAEKVAAVPGVAKATPGVYVQNARVIGKNGKVVPTVGAPQAGMDWPGENGLVELRSGRGPAAADEVAIDAALAKSSGYGLGDRIGVLTLKPKKTFTVVGIFGYSGNRDTLGGSQTTAFTMPVAQDLLLGERDAVSVIDVVAAKGVADTTLRDDIAAAVGGDYKVLTGKQTADAQAAGLKTFLNFFTYVLLGFAGVALFVGIFLILNTFSMLVAQRTRELALMRAIGASRRQVIGSVLLEASVIGLVASVLGLGAGVGVGAAIAAFFSSFGGTNLDLSIGVPPAAVIAAFAVGLGVTLVAATVPAIRASRIPPVAAMRDAATPDKPLTKITAFGAVVLVAGATAMAFALTGNASLWLLMAGVLLTFVGVALLTPIISRPVVSLLGRLFAWSMPGQLGRRNSARNPRRTAVTAGALMVSIALVTGVSTILASATTSISKSVEKTLQADLVISGQQTGPMPPTFDPALVGRVTALPGVERFAALYQTMGTANGDRTFFGAVNDLGAARHILGLQAASGSVDSLGAGQLVVDERTAKSRGLTLGEKVEIQLPRGEATAYTVSGIYKKNDASNGILLPADAVKNFAAPAPTMGMIQLRQGADAKPVQDAVDKLLADSPEVTVADRSAFVEQQTATFGTILKFIQILLALAIVIAVLGIINTLALSVIERTREIGLLRAIGLRRSQTMRMITVESVVISLFGTLLGIAVGIGLGAAVVRALKDEGFTSFSLPWSQMAIYLVAAAVIGVVAAILPAIRAARLNVLQAISYE
ncbi:MAG TPA: FtsX-like permease family protein [Mycobacteriales bacterium]